MADLPTPHNTISIAPTAISENVPPRGKAPRQLTPRSAGFVLHSRRGNTADYSEFADAARQFNSIRNFLSEVAEEKEPRRKSGGSSFSRSRSLKKIFQMSAPKVPRRVVEPQKTPDGLKYGKIVTQHQFDIGFHASSYQVNNTGRDRRKATSKDPQKKTSTSMGTAHTREDEAMVESQSVVPRNDTGVSVDQSEATNLVQQGTGTPRRFIETPSIHLSPMKFSLDLAASSETPDWLDQLGNQRNPRRLSPSHVPVKTAEDHSKTRDFARHDGNLFQHTRAIAPSSGSPQKKDDSPTKAGNDHNTVAGMSHKYPVFPSFKQRIEDLRNSQIKGKEPEQVNLPGSLQLSPLPQAPPPSPIAREFPTSLQASPIIEDPREIPTTVMTEENATSAHSSTSTGVVANAQSAVRMHIPTATSQFVSSSSCDIPMPGPAPDRALPSLPEGHDSPGSKVPVATERIPKSIDSQEPFPIQAAIPPKSPKRQGYRIFPSDSSPPQTKAPASPARIHNSRESNDMVITPSSPSKTQRGEVSIFRPDHAPHDTRAGALDQLQIQRKERTAARKARDLAQMSLQNGLKEQSEVIEPSAQSSIEYHDGVTILPDNDEMHASIPFSDQHQQKSSQISDANLPVNQHNSKHEHTTQVPKISSIMVVAEQKPVSPTDSCHTSHNSRHTSSGSNIEHRPRSSKENNNVHIHVSYPGPSSLQTPDEKGKIRPLSAHSMPTSIPRPVSSRTPTPFAHQLLRNQSNRSSMRSSSVQQETHVRDLEARLSAIEKKNVMLQKLFLAVINDTSRFGYDEAGDGSNGVEDDGGEFDDGASVLRGAEGSLNGNGSSNDVRDRGNRSSVAESLYAGLENLLAVHASEAGQRLSNSNFI